MLLKVCNFTSGTHIKMATQCVWGAAATTTRAWSQMQPARSWTLCARYAARSLADQPSNKGGTLSAPACCPLSPLAQKLPRLGLPDILSASLLLVLTGSACAALTVPAGLSLLLGSRPDMWPLAAVSFPPAVQPDSSGSLHRRAHAFLAIRNAGCCPPAPPLGSSRLASDHNSLVVSMQGEAELPSPLNWSKGTDQVSLHR